MTASYYSPRCLNRISMLRGSLPSKASGWAVGSGWEMLPWYALLLGSEEAPGALAKGALFCLTLRRHRDPRLCPILSGVFAWPAPSPAPFAAASSRRPQGVGSPCCLFPRGQPGTGRRKAHRISIRRQRRGQSGGVGEGGFASRPRAVRQRFMLPASLL